jgi:hypothetical protein
LSTPIDETIKDYCETNLDDISHLKRTYSFDKSPRKMKHSRSSGFIRKKSRQKKRMGSCCSLEFCNTTKKNIREKKELTFTQHIFAPIVNLKDLISTSLSSSNDIKSISLPEKPSVASALLTITPQSSYKSPVKVPYPLKLIQIIII